MNIPFLAIGSMNVKNKILHLEIQKLLDLKGRVFDFSYTPKIVSKKKHVTIEKGYGSNPSIPPHPKKKKGKKKW